MSLPFPLDPFEALNQACVATFPSTAQFYPRAGGGPISIKGARKDPPMMDSFGIASTTGTSVAHFFINLSDITPTPVVGDKFVIGTQTYDMFDVGVDVVNGCFLKLRKGRS